MFRKFDAGEAHRPPGGDRRDCQVRALATARGIPYREAWDLLYLIQGEMRFCGFTIVESLTKGDPRLGAVRKLAFKAERGRPRMTARRFCELHRRGNFILRMAHHVAAVKDGVLFDTLDTSDLCVYTAWQVEPVRR